MDGQIDENGRLSIWRKDKMVLQECCNTSRICSDCCALFGEPKELSITYGGGYTISLCHKTLDFENFKDLRQNYEEDV